MFGYIRELALSLLGYQPLYIVAVAICPTDYAFDCNRNLAPEFHPFWVYRPNLEECQRFGSEMLASLDFDSEAQQARIYCVRAEVFQDAQSFVYPGER
jgi:hypothetical protein